MSKMKLNITCGYEEGGKSFIDNVHPEIVSAILTQDQIMTLSVKQPWAWLLAHGHKPVENRDWATRHRGVFLIHASLNIDKKAYEWLKSEIPEIYAIVPKPEEIEVGGIVGAARITDCVTKHLSIWFFGKYGFVVDHATPLPFMKSKGQLGLYKTSYKAS